MRRYIRFTGWVWLAKVTLQAITWIGWLVALPLLFTSPALVMALCPHPIVMLAASQQLPLGVFLAIGLIRLLVADPVNYYLGRHNAEFVLSTNKHQLQHKSLRRPYKRLRRCLTWLEKADGRWLLGATFLSRVVPIMPPLVCVNTVCGAANVGLKRLLIIDGFAVLTYLSLIIVVGDSFNPMEWLHEAM